MLTHMGGHETLRKNNVCLLSRDIYSCGDFAFEKYSPVVVEHVMSGYSQVVAILGKSDHIR